MDNTSVVFSEITDVSFSGYRLRRSFFYEEQVQADNNPQRMSAVIDFLFSRPILTLPFSAQVTLSNEQILCCQDTRCGYPRWRRHAHFPPESSIPYPKRPLTYTTCEFQCADP